MKSPEPRWEIGRAWSTSALRALGPTSTEEEVLEALALAGAVSLLPGVLDAVPPGDRRRLAARGAALLLASSRLEGDTDEVVARSRALALARTGLEALRRNGEPSVASASEPRRAVGVVSPRTLRRFLDGALDGFAAAELAVRARVDERTRVELAVMAGFAPPTSNVPTFSSTEADEPRLPGASKQRSDAVGRPREGTPRLRLVADDDAALRDPDRGERVGTARSGSVELEAVRFPDGFVAIYAAPARRIAVPVLPSGMKLVRTALGYVELDARKARGKEVEVAVGSHRVTLTIR